MAGKKRAAKSKKSSDIRKKTGVKTVASENDEVNQNGEVEKNDNEDKIENGKGCVIKQNLGAVAKKNCFKVVENTTGDGKKEKGSHYVPNIGLPKEVDSRPRSLKYGVSGKTCLGKLPGQITRAFLIIEPTNDVFMLRPHDVCKRMEILGNLLEKMVGDLEFPIESNRDTFLEDMCILNCDGMWLRAACSQVTKDRIYCYLLDGGFFTWATYTNMLPMTQKMIDLLPFQALECELAGITRTVVLSKIRHVIYQFLDCEAGMCYAMHESDRPSGNMGGPSFQINLLNRYGMSLNKFFLDANFATAVPQSERFRRDAFIISHRSIDSLQDNRKYWHFVKVVDTCTTSSNTDPVIMIDVSTLTYGISAVDISTNTNLVIFSDVSTATEAVITTESCSYTDPIKLVDAMTTTEDVSYENIVITASVGTSTMHVPKIDAETSTDFETEYNIYEQWTKTVTTAEAASSTEITFSDKGTICDEQYFTGTDRMQPPVKASLTDAATFTTIAVDTDEVLESSNAALMTSV